MKEKIYEILVYVAPLVAGFITSVVIPLLVKKFSVNYLKKKIEEVDSGKELQEIKSELRSIRHEILEMRGKIKWRKDLYGIL